MDVLMGVGVGREVRVYEVLGCYLETYIDRVKDRDFGDRLSIWV